MLLTVDTEFGLGHHHRGLGWRENFARSFEAAGVGVPWQLETLRRHDLKATFFVDPMPALLFGIDPVRAMVAPILAAGQDVQLHLHSSWWDLAHGRTPPRCELIDYPAEEQHAQIAQARELLIEAGAPPPIAFRAGSYAADLTTLASLEALGLRFDSSFNGSQTPWPCALPFAADRIAPFRHGGLIEIPVGQIEDRPGHLRHLQLCALSVREFCAAARHAVAHSHPVLSIVSHSFELATRDGLRPNRLLQRRFERLCAFLAGEREQLPTAHFADLDDLPLDRLATPLPPRGLRRAHRLVEQFWSDTRYERPATAAAAVCGTMLAGIETMAPLVVAG